MRPIYIILFAVLGIASAAAYFQSSHENAPVINEDILRVALLPDENTQVLRDRYQPLIEYLAISTGRKIELLIPADYHASVDLFRDHKVDLAIFGGLTFLKANNLYGAKPLVSRDVDMHFTSWFIVNAGNDAQNLKNLKGKKLAFGSELSTSGHLMPRHFMQAEYEIAPETFFSQINYSGAHDKTAYMVRDKQVDVGVANAEILQQMLSDGRLEQKDIRLLWETPPYPDYTWATPAHLDESTRNQLRDVFLSIDESNPQHKKILANLGAHSFVPAALKDFAPLKEVAENLDMLGQ